MWIFIFRKYLYHIVSSCIDFPQNTCRCTEACDSHIALRNTTQHVLRSDPQSFLGSSPLPQHCSCVKSASTNYHQRMCSSVLCLTLSYSGSPLPQVEYGKIRQVNLFESCFDLGLLNASFSAKLHGEKDQACRRVCHGTFCLEAGPFPCCWRPMSNLQLHPLSHQEIQRETPTAPKTLQKSSEYEILWWRCSMNFHDVKSVKQMFKH